MQPPSPYQQPSSAEQPPQKKGGIPGWAIALIVCGLCCCGSPIIAAILFPVFSQAKVAAKTSRSLSNLKQISLGWIIYAGDCDDRSVEVKGWNENVLNSLPSSSETDKAKILNDPLLSSETEQRGYGINAGAAGIEIAKIETPAKMIVFGLTTTPRQDALVTKDTLRKASGAPYRTLWSTADGAAKKALINEAQRLEWKPKLN